MLVARDAHRTLLISGGSSVRIDDLFEVPEKLGNPGRALRHVGDLLLARLDVSSTRLQLCILASEFVEHLAVRGDLGAILEISDTWLRETIIGEIPLRPTPDEIRWLGTAAWTVELERDDRCSSPQSGYAAEDTTQEKREGARAQDIRSAAEVDQLLWVMKKAGAG